MISWLPPFINAAQPIFEQSIHLISLILTIEFGWLLIYAKGGSALRHFLEKQDNVKLLNNSSFGVHIYQ